jgi:2-polyprenyl-6-methoxyphenol hydroxylase-like FAD-dependent oxidoreductase
VAPEEKVVVGVRYATTHLLNNHTDIDGRVVVISAATPEVPRAAAAIRQEDGTWTLTVAGYTENQPPLDPEGFRAFARTVAAPEIGELVDRHDLIGGIAHYRFPHCVRRRIEQVRLPERYAVLGDAISSFDPTFGQGMSVAALEAVALGQCLEKLRPGGLPLVLADYHRKCAHIVDQVWTLVVGAVLDLDGVTGERPRGHALLSAYVRAAQRAARDDSQVALALMRATNLLAPPQSLMAPRVALRVARASLAQRAPRGSQRRPEATVPA